MTINELKAHVYDVLVQIEVLQNELRATNQAIAKAQAELDAATEAQSSDTAVEVKPITIKPTPIEILK